jgi:hypothetical protein
VETLTISLRARYWSILPCRSYPVVSFPSLDYDSLVVLCSDSYGPDDAHPTRSYDILHDCADLFLSLQPSHILLRPKSGGFCKEPSTFEPAAVYAKESYWPRLASSPAWDHLISITFESMLVLWVPGRDYGPRSRGRRWIWDWTRVEGLGLDEKYGEADLLELYGTGSSSQKLGIARDLSIVLRKDQEELGEIASFQAGLQTGASVYDPFIMVFRSCYIEN